MARDAVIVGGGHNGLVAAAYLARNGLDALVCERREVVGGAAVSEHPFGPDYTVTSLSYVVSLLPAGTHGGGGVTGIPGRNAVRQILADGRAARWRRPGRLAAAQPGAV